MGSSKFITKRSMGSIAHLRIISYHAIIKLEQKFWSHKSWYYPPKERVWLSIEQSWIPFTRECFEILSSLAENGPLVLENTILKYLLCFFLVILLLSPLEKYVVHHFNKQSNINPFHLRMLCAKFDWNYR